MKNLEKNIKIKKSLKNKKLSKKKIKILKDKKSYNLTNFLLKDYFLSLNYYKNIFLVHNRELIRYKKFKNRFFKLRLRLRRYSHLYKKNADKSKITLKYWFSRFRWLRFRICYYFEKLFLCEMYNRFFKRRGVSEYSTLVVEKYNIFKRLNNVLNLSFKFNLKNKKILNNFEYLYKYKNNYNNIKLDNFFQHIEKNKSQILRLKARKNYLKSTLKTPKIKEQFRRRVIADKIKVIKSTIKKYEYKNNQLFNSVYDRIYNKNNNIFKKRLSISRNKIRKDRKNLFIKSLLYRKILLLFNRTDNTKNNYLCNKISRRNTLAFRYVYYPVDNTKNNYFFIPIRCYNLWDTVLFKRSRSCNASLQRKSIKIPRDNKIYRYVEKSLGYSRYDSLRKLDRVPFSKFTGLVDSSRIFISSILLPNCTVHVWKTGLYNRIFSVSQGNILFLGIDRYIFRPSLSWEQHLVNSKYPSRAIRLRKTQSPLYSRKWIPASSKLKRNCFKYALHSRGIDYKVSTVLSKLYDSNFISGSKIRVESKTGVTRLRGKFTTVFTPNLVSNHSIFRSVRIPNNASSSYIKQNYSTSSKIKINTIEPSENSKSLQNDSRQNGLRNIQNSGRKKIKIKKIKLKYKTIWVLNKLKIKQLIFNLFKTKILRKKFLKNKKLLIKLIKNNQLIINSKIINFFFKNKKLLFKLLKKNLNLNFLLTKRVKLVQIKKRRPLFNNYLKCLNNIKQDNFCYPFNNIFKVKNYKDIKYGIYKKKKTTWHRAQQYRDFNGRYLGLLSERRDLFSRRIRFSSYSYNFSRIGIFSSFYNFSKYNGVAPNKIIVSLFRRPSSQAYKIYKSKIFKKISKSLFKKIQNEIIRRKFYKKRRVLLRLNLSLLKIKFKNIILKKVINFFLKLKKKLNKKKKIKTLKLTNINNKKLKRLKNYKIINSKKLKISKFLNNRVYRLYLNLKFLKAIKLNNSTKSSIRKNDKFSYQNKKFTTNRNNNSNYNKNKNFDFNRSYNSNKTYNNNINYTKKNNNNNYNNTPKFYNNKSNFKNNSDKNKNRRYQKLLVLEDAILKHKRDSDYANKISKNTYFKKDKKDKKNINLNTLFSNETKPFSGINIVTGAPSTNFLEILKKNNVDSGGDNIDNKTDKSIDSIFDILVTNKKKPKDMPISNFNKNEYKKFNK
jgi:hypothetical protein